MGYATSAGLVQVVMRAAVRCTCEWEGEGLTPLELYRQVWRYVWDEERPSCDALGEGLVRAVCIIAVDSTLEEL